MHCKLKHIKTKFSFTLKTIDLWSYLKVFTGIKEKNKETKNFWVGWKSEVRPYKFFRKSEFSRETF